MKPPNDQPLPTRRMIPKQERFCREYLVDLNASGAARRAGYSGKAAHVQGSRLLANVAVGARIAELQSGGGLAAGADR